MYLLILCQAVKSDAAFRSESKDWLARNHNNMSEWGRHVYPRTVVSVS